VEDLQRAVDELRRLHTEAGTAVRALRQASRQAAADLSRLRAELAEAEAAEAKADAGRSDARRVLAFAEAQLRQARDREAVREKAAAAKQSFAELLASARELLGRGARLARTTRPAELLTRLEAAESAAAETLDEHRRDAATLAGRLATVRASAS